MKISNQISALKKILSWLKPPLMLDRLEYPHYPLNIALQLPSYHVDLIEGTDVEQPKNLAKSVMIK